jgi:AcrR family transcriptional regulator
MSLMESIKERLICAAGEEFAEKGFEGATIRSICARAEANIAAVNYHFGDKSQLYNQTLLEAHRWGESETEHELPWNATHLPPDQQLRHFVRHLLSRVFSITSEGWQFQLIMREMLQPTGASAFLVRERIGPRFQYLNTILKQIVPHVDEIRLSAIAFSVIGQCLFYRMARPITQHLLSSSQLDSLNLDYLTDHISQFTLAALGAAPPISQSSRPVSWTASQNPLPLSSTQLVTEVNP